MTSAGQRRWSVRLSEPPEPFIQQSPRRGVLSSWPLKPCHPKRLFRAGVTLLLVAAFLVPATPAVAAVPSDNAFPVQGHSVSSCADDFGAPRSGGRVHQGNDCFAPVGTPLV